MGDKLPYDEYSELQDVIINLEDAFCHLPKPNDDCIQDARYKKLREGLSLINEFHNENINLVLNYEKR